MSDDNTYSGQVAADATYSQLSPETASKKNTYEVPVTLIASKRSQDKKLPRKSLMSLKSFVIAVTLLLIVAYLVISSIVGILALVKISQNQNTSFVEHVASSEMFTLLLERLEALEDMVELLNKNVTQRVTNQEFEMMVTRLEVMINSAYDHFSDELQETNQVFEMLIGSSPCLPAPSCAALPSCASSGYYWVRVSNGSAVRVYCDMTRTCGNVTGGWMRVGYLDMTNSGQQCPSGLRERYDSDIRTCVRSSDSAGCSSVTYPTFSVNYTSVCGRIKAYQYGTTNAFRALYPTPKSINSPYVDGVSITHGMPSRSHIWTFAAALDKSGTFRSFTYCFCQKSSYSVHASSFVGSDYFCDSGNEEYVKNQLEFYSADPLWDGAGCGAGNMCCSFNSPPWFYKQLPQPTTDDIEMRVCRDEDADNEDIAIELVEIYVQ